MISLHVLFFFKKKSYFSCYSREEKLKNDFFFFFKSLLSLPLDMPKHKESKRQGEKSSQQMTKAQSCCQGLDFFFLFIFCF